MQNMITMEGENFLQQLVGLLIRKPALVKDLALNVAAKGDDSCDELLDSPSIASQSPAWMKTVLDEFKERETYSCVACESPISIKELYGNLTEGLANSINVEAACCCSGCGEVNYLSFRLKPVFDEQRVELLAINNDGEWDSVVGFER